MSVEREMSMVSDITAWEKKLRWLAENINGSEIRITKNHLMTLNGMVSQGTSLNYFWDYLNYEKKEETNRKIALSLKKNPSTKQ